MANKKDWIRPATNRMRRRGTVGSFTAWCKRHGYDGVNARSIVAGKRVGGKIAKKATFAGNMRKARHAKGGTIGQEEYSIGGILGGMGSGAGIGASIGGPWGAGIGAMVGAGAGIVGHFKERRDEREQEGLYSQYQDKQQQMMLDANQDQYIAGIESNQAVNPFTPTFPYGGSINGVNAEVEDDEVLRRPNGKLRKVSGRTHMQGGIDVNEPAGTQVFSDREIYKPTGKTFAIEADIIRKRIAELDKQLV